MEESTVTMNGTSNGVQGNKSQYLAHEMIMKLIVSQALKAVLKLGIPDILYGQGGRSLTAEEIFAQLPAKTPEKVNNLSRPLKILVLEGLFTESFNDKNQSMYGLTEVSKWFVKDTPNNMLPVADFHLGCADLNLPMNHLASQILDDNVVPVVEVLGCPGYEYAMKNPSFGAAFQAAMVTYSNMDVPAIMDCLQKNGVLKGVETVVDVGGGTGSVVAQIIAKFPHIKGINFDLPIIVARAPEVEGKTNIGGNMFESVPSGDALLVKNILHNYDDKAVLKILTNCFEALPKQGKVIIVEYILPDGPDFSPKARMAATFDIVMQIFNKGAQERTKAHHQGLIAAAGFSRCEFILNAEAVDLIIAHKG